MTPLDTIWIGAAFAAGYLARRLGMPPLIGFLAAGFLLNYLGIREGELLKILGDLGVTILLFTIGLKLQVGTLGRPEVWAGTSLHMLFTVIALMPLFLLFSFAGLYPFSELTPAAAALIAFALSFSSTVLSVKFLEEKGEMTSGHGKVSVGILVMQDVLAVVFLTASTGKIPSPWAVAVILGLFLLKPFLFRIMDRCDHGELTILFGFFLALVLGAASFESVSLKPDLGALMVGMLMAGHPRSKEYASSLMGFKEMMLIGFFLSIGLSADISMRSVFAGLLVVLLLPVKVIIYYYIIQYYKKRIRTGFLASVNLASYSEFGLIVAGTGVSAGWIAADWLVIIAVALSISFFTATRLNDRADRIYIRWQFFLSSISFRETGGFNTVLPGPESRILILGMGRIGKGAYDYLKNEYPEQICGIEMLPETAAHHLRQKRNVICTDATDPDFWEMMAEKKILQEICLIILAMPRHKSNRHALELIRKTGYKGIISAICMYEDQIDDLLEAGANTAFNIYSEAGIGLGEHVHRVYQAKLQTQLGTDLA